MGPWDQGRRRRRPVVRAAEAVISPWGGVLQAVTGAPSCAQTWGSVAQGADSGRGWSRPFRASLAPRLAEPKALEPARRPRFPRAPQHHDAQAWAPGTARCLAVCTPSPHCLFLAPILPGLASMPGGPSSPLHCQGPGPLPWVTSALYKTGTNSRPRTTLVVHSGYFVYGFILSSATEEVF